LLMIQSARPAAHATSLNFLLRRDQQSLAL
jgi:hypothetical protein